MPTQFHWPLHGNIQTQRCIECATNPQSNLPPHSSGNCPNLRSIGLWKVTCTAFHLDDSCVVVVQNTSLAIYFVNHHVLKCVNVNSAIKCNSANISIVSHNCEMTVELTSLSQTYTCMRHNLLSLKHTPSPALTSSLSNTHPNPP